MTKDRSNKYFMMFQSAKSIELSDAARPLGENAAAESDRLFSIVGSRLFWNELWFEYWKKIWRGAAHMIGYLFAPREAIVGYCQRQTSPSSGSIISPARS
jgi:hypothetical protein